jgi:hypothetical protein
MKGKPPIFHSLFAFFAFVVNFLLFAGQVESAERGFSLYSVCGGLG